MKAIELRLVRLERSSDAGWTAYRGVPLDQWRDAVVLAFLEPPPNAPDADPRRVMATGSA